MTQNENCEYVWGFLYSDTGKAFVFLTKLKWDLNVPGTTIT